MDNREGVVYIGDGAWVASPRTGESKNEWYINQFASKNHGIIVTLHGDRQEYVVVSSDGDEIDTYQSLHPRR